MSSKEAGNNPGLHPVIGQSGLSSRIRARNRFSSLSLEYW
jgi:hypothetical protein